jgi:hypothetical protein
MFLRVLRTMCYVMNDFMKYFISHVFHLQTNNGLFSFYVVHDSIMFPAFHKSLFFHGGGTNYIYFKKHNSIVYVL